jgi:scyllo-inositol 2-dehydrogenase (NADP+)
MNAMKQVKAAIIGQGRSGRDIHAFSLGKMSDRFQIVAVSDPLEERRIRAEKELGCEAYADYRDLFKRDDVDLIVNASPSHMHVPVTLEILNNGFHALCEKPLARRTEDVDLLIDAAERSGKVLAVFQQSRFSPAFQQLRKVIDSGVLGRVVQVSIAYNGFSRRWDWQTLQANNGGNLLNTGPHPLDQALQLFGTDVMPQVLCRMDRANTYGDAEDYVKLILHGDGRPTIDVEISSCCAYPSFTYNVQGTRGGLKGSTSRLDWKYFIPEEAPEQQLITTPLNKPDGSPAYCGEQLEWHEKSWDISDEKGSNLFHTMAEQYYSMLYNTLTAGEPLRVTVQEVRQQIAVMQESFRQNPSFASNANATVL